MERREFPRISDTMLLELDNGYGMVVDLSLQGMRITPDQLPPERDITLRLKLNSQIIILKGEICWHMAHSKQTGQPELGIRLTEIPESYRRYILSLMARPEEQDEERKLDRIFENRYNVTISPDAISEGVFELELPERELPVRSFRSGDEDDALADIFAS